MMLLIWLLVYLVEDAPNIFNNNGHDAGWIISGVVCLIMTILEHLGDMKEKDRKERKSDG